MTNKFIIAKLLLLFLTPLLLFQSCSEDNPDNIKEENTIEESNKLLEALKQLGFSDDSIVDKGSYYQVEGDMIFDKDKEYLFLNDENTSKETAPTTSKTKQRKTPFSVSLRVVNIYVNTGLSTFWIDASRSAIARWNAVGSGLTLVEVDFPEEAHIEITSDNLDPNMTLALNTIGTARIPTADGLPGVRTWINYDFRYSEICGRRITQNDRIANVQHELGHNLGFMHTFDGNSELIPGTPEADFESVMRGGSACRVKDFSSDDIKAIRILFPPK